MQISYQKMEVPVFLMDQLKKERFRDRIEVPRLQTTKYFPQNLNIVSACPTIPVPI